MLSEKAAHVTAVDYSADALEYAKEHYAADNITYVQADAHTLPFEDASFDVVVSLETIEHLKDPGTFVKEVRRVLKKDGVFLVSTPNDDEFMDGNEFHIHEFSLAELREVIKKHFKNADFYCQATYLGVSLMNNDQVRSGGQVGKAEVTFGQPEAKAVYHLAVAGDSQLPVLESNVVLSDRWSTKEDFERDAERIKAIKHLQREIKSLHAAADEYRRAYQTEAKNFAEYRRRHGGSIIPIIRRAAKKALRK
jgi:SAM-dependent methyltransferase